MRLKAEVTGGPALRRRLVDMLPDKIRARISEAMTKGARNIARQARATAPQDTGELVGTIHSTNVRTDKRGRLAIYVVAGNRATQTEGPSGSFQIARLVEFGAQDRPAEPFLMPAYKSQRRNIQTAIRRAVAKAVREA